jgi:excisionase family DNA binding protein
LALGTGVRTLHTVHDMQEMQGGHMGGTHHVLTARQVQNLLHVDRSTVYRMAEDGRLPAIKVGRQWRFPADQITALLESVGLPATQSAEAAEAATDAQSAEAVLAVAGDLLGVMMVVTDMDGRPLTPVANPCDWFADRADDPEVISACSAEWQSMADDPDFAPRFRTGVLGFQCARAFIRSGTSLVGMVLAGGIAPESSTTPGLYHLPEDERQRVLAALPRVAAVLSRVPARQQAPGDRRQRSADQGSSA